MNATRPAVRGISSMATRLLLAELCERWQAQGGVPVQIESVGGVDAARRVRDGEAFDLVVLARDAMDKLVSVGRVAADSLCDLVHSPVAVAVPLGAPVPALDTEAALREAVLAAPTLGYSTGPSGVALQALFERWGLAATLAPRIVQAPAGVPVGQLIAQGQVALGFQQLSELIHVPGIQIVGAMPQAVQIITTFSAGVCLVASQAQAARDWIAFASAPAAAQAKRRQGMEPA